MSLHAKVTLVRSVHNLRAVRMQCMYACLQASAASSQGAALAVLCGVSTNHDGRAATITAPNGTAQQRVLRSTVGLL